MNRGLTTLEILLVIGTLTVFVGFVAPPILDFYKIHQLNNYTQDIVRTLRMAQLKAMSIESDCSFGVYLTNDTYTLFKGDSYSNRSPEFDEVSELPRVITTDGLKEIVFLKFEGLPKENAPYCGGICTPCNQLKSFQCQQQAGCSWSQGVCSGVCTSCQVFTQQTTCQQQLGCSWYVSTRGGDIILNSNGKTRTININAIGKINPH